MTNALRFSTIAVGAMLTVLAGIPGAVLRLAYRPEFASGATALRLLSLGQGAFALVTIATTIVLAGGRVVAATTLVCAMLAGVFVGDWIGIHVAVGPSAALAGTAAGTAAGCVFGLAVVGAYMVRTFGGFVRAGTFVRCAVRRVRARGAGRSRSAPVHEKVWTLILAGAGVVLYAVALVGSWVRSAQVDEQRRRRATSEGEVWVRVSVEELTAPGVPRFAPKKLDAPPTHLTRGGVPRCARDDGAFQST